MILTKLKYNQNIQQCSNENRGGLVNKINITITIFKKLGIYNTTNS